MKILTLKTEAQILIKDNYQTHLLITQNFGQNPAHFFYSIQHVSILQPFKIFHF